MAPQLSQGRVAVSDVRALLDEFWRDTATWDPMLNGTTEAEMDAVGDPNDPTLTPDQRRAVIEARGKVGDRHQWEHDLAVGQRIAVRQLKYRLDRLVKSR